MTPRPPFRSGLGRRALLACAVAIAVAGCSIPAKLNRPPVRDDVPLAGLDTGHRAGWPDAAWWKQYNDPQLDQLIELATKDSPDIAQASARVDSAQQNIRAANSATARQCAPCCYHYVIRSFQGSLNRSHPPRPDRMAVSAHCSE